MENCSDTLLDTRLKDINRLYELGFIEWQSQGSAIHEVIRQEISREPDIESSLHPNHFPLNK